MVFSMITRTFRTVLCLVLAGLLVGAPALAKDADGGDDARSDDDGRREARVSAICSKGATSSLRLRSRDGVIRLEFWVKRRPRGEAWRIVLVHERRVEWRHTLRTSGSSGTFRVRRTITDYDGPDHIHARASGPRGLTCAAEATLRA